MLLKLSFVFRVKQIHLMTSTYLDSFRKLKISHSLTVTASQLSFLSSSSVRLLLHRRRSVQHHPHSWRREAHHWRGSHSHHRHRSAVHEHWWGRQSVEHSGRGIRRRRNSHSGLGWRGKGIRGDLARFEGSCGRVDEVLGLKGEALDSVPENVFRELTCCSIHFW